MDKNHVGRPTNEELSLRKRKKLLIILVPIMIIAVIIGFIIGSGSLNNLMGDSVTSDYYCIDGDELKYSSNNKKYYCRSEKDFILLGDVNKDKVINIRDVTVIQKYLDGKYELDDSSVAAADVNKDGNISILDAKIIQESVTGVRVSSTGTNSSNLLYNEEYVCPIHYSKESSLCSFTYDAIEKVIDINDFVFLQIQETMRVKNGDKVGLVIKNKNLDKVGVSLSTIKNGNDRLYVDLKAEGSNEMYSFNVDERFKNSLYYVSGIEFTENGKTHYIDVSSSVKIQVESIDYIK